VLKATGIHQVLAWDITLLPGPVKGQFYYLYMVMDVWSRRILGVEVHERECGELAKHFFDRICRDEGINSGTSTILHADNGAPMRSYTLAALARRASARGSLPSWALRCYFTGQVSETTMPMLSHYSVGYNTTKAIHPGASGIFSQCAPGWMALWSGTTLSTGKAASSM
jgi:Integrase core domain